MIKYILLAAAWMLPLAAAHAQTAMSWEDTIKESIDATHVPDRPMAPDGTLTPSDLTLDPDFLNGGMHPFFPFPRPVGTSLVQDGLRVFPSIGCITTPAPMCLHNGYYVVGRIRNTDGTTWHSAISQRNLDGSINQSFGTDGWMYPSAQQADVVDAAMGNGRMYILSTIDLVGIPAMRVTCTDLTTGANCSGFTGVQTFGATISGAIRGAYARRIVYDSRYGLFIAGRVETVARGWEIAVARLDAGTGALNASFHGNGTTIGLPTWAAQTDSFLDVFDMTVVPSGTPGGERLYIAGTVKLGATDHDGFVLGLNPNDGYTLSGWAWNNYYHEDDNSGFKKDAITAITVQRNGRLAMAGWSETDVANEHVTFIARALATGDRDGYAFCANNLAMCRVPVRPLIGVTNDDFPVAIAERAGNRDLVIALKSRSRSGDYHPVQTVYQISSGGKTAHEIQTMDFATAPGNEGWSRPFGMVMVKDGVVGIPGTESIAVVGTRRWNNAAFDFTLSHLIANDSIFADQFGGKQGD